MTSVLMIGFTAEASDLSGAPVTVDQLREIIAAGDADVAAAGYEVHRGWIGTDHDAGVAEVRRLLDSAEFDIVMIGNGVRGNPKFTELFEQLVNLVHRAAPTSTLAFNSDPPSTLAALRRNT